MKTLFVLLQFLLILPGLAQQRLVNVNGVQFNTYVKGIENKHTTSPVVVFESGMGVDLGNWNRVIDQIADFAPVLAYERTGIGKSDRVFEMPTPQNVRL